MVCREDLKNVFIKVEVESQVISALLVEPKELQCASLSDIATLSQVL